MSRPDPRVPLDFERLPPDQMLERARGLHEQLARRPLGAPLQRRADPARGRARGHPRGGPVTLRGQQAAVDLRAGHRPRLKRQIREAAEAEERTFYEERASERWLEDLAHLGTDAHKPYLEEAPALVVAFAQPRGPGDEQHYYVKESVGLACGALIAALHLSGLATLTHTPSPMGFLSEILGRPDHERPFLLLPVGYPAQGCTVPDLTRKPDDEILVEYGGS